MPARTARCEGTTSTIRVQTTARATKSDLNLVICSFGHLVIDLVVDVVIDADPLCRSAIPNASIDSPIDSNLAIRPVRPINDQITR